MRALPILLLSLIWGCDSVDNLEIPIKGRSTVPGANPVETLLGTFPAADGFTRVDLAQSQTFRNKEYTVDDVDSVNLIRLTMKTLTPATQDLAFLGTVIFRAEVDGLPNKEIARREGFPMGATSVEFTVTPDDLKEYLLAKEATIATEILDSRRPPQETVVEIEAVFDVDINLL